MGRKTKEQKRIEELESILAHQKDVHDKKNNDFNQRIISLETSASKLQKENNQLLLQLRNSRGATGLFVDMLMNEASLEIRAIPKNKPIQNGEQLGKQQ